MVVYRDLVDSQVLSTRDFTRDLTSFAQALAGQYPSGGGDFPEACDLAFAELPKLTWRTDPTTARLVFWVADAPHHNDAAAAMAASLRDTQARDVHVYPVASSGIDELTELTMRSSAQMTGGRYLFLTDDSGVGGVHKEPTIPCYFVTHLDSALLRMVQIELSGVYTEPAPEEIIRTGGDPTNGACVLASGEQVFVF